MKDVWERFIRAARRFRRFMAAIVRRLSRPVLKPLQRCVERIICRGVIRAASSIEYGLRMRAILASADFVYANIPLHKRFPLFALRWMALACAPKEGLLLEFGVYQGYSINLMGERTDRTIYGFDSFEGLPEPWSQAPAGWYNTGGTVPSVWSNVGLIKGWFHESLPPFLEEHPEKVALVHLDCDLYSSTETVLELLHPRFVEGTILLMDDFMCEPGWQEQEHKAFFDYVRRHGVEFEYLGYSVDAPSTAVAVQLTKLNSHLVEDRTSNLD